MTKKEIIQGLQFTIDMFLSDPLTGEALEKPRNDMDKTTIDACKGAIELLEQQPCEDKIIEWKKDFKEYVNSLSMLNDDYKGIMEYIDELPVTSEPCEDTISREQAIDAVSNLFEISEYPHPYSQGKPIRLKDIKEKLKHLPPVQPKKIECVDAISREDAMSMILCYGNEIKAEVMDDIKASMIKLPPAQPMIKTGHWIHRSTDEYGGTTTWYECSECGRSVEDIYHVYGEYPYCHCGAKMVEPQESEKHNGKV